MEKERSSIDSDNDLFGDSPSDDKERTYPTYQQQEQGGLLQQRLEKEKEDERMKHEDDSDASSSSPSVQVESDKDLSEDSSSSASSCQEDDDDEDDGEDDEDDDDSPKQPPQNYNDDSDDDDQSSISSSNSNPNHNHNHNHKINHASLLEEEIVLNETILESLQTRIIALNHDIEHQRQNVKQHDYQIKFLDQRRQQLRKTREENTALLRGVSYTLDKCIRTWKRKLQDRGWKAADATRVHVPDVDVDVDVVGSSNDFSDCQRNLDLVSSLGANNEQKEELQNDTISENEIPNIDIVDVDDVDDDADEDANSNVYPSISIAIKSPYNEQYMKQRWSQNHPDHIPLFHAADMHTHTNTMLPLHHPFTSAKTLKQIVEIGQSETIARRKGMTEVELERDHLRSVQLTVLDLYACTAYDPHFLPLQRHQRKRKRVQADAKGGTREEDVNGNGNGKEDVKVGEAGVAMASNETVVENVVQQDHERGHKIDVNTIICRKALFGKCTDPLCAYQHLSGRANVKTTGRSNKLWTVETNRQGREVILPVYTYPIPPPPCEKRLRGLDGVWVRGGNSLRRVDDNDDEGGGDEGDSLEENPSVNLSFQETESMPISEPKESVGDDLDRGSPSIEDSIEENQDKNDVDQGSPAIEEKEDNVDNDLVHDSPPSVKEEEDRVSSNHTSGDGDDSLAVKSSEEETSNLGSFGDNEDFIVLPTIDDDNDEAQISSNIQMALSNCEKNEDEMMSQDHEYQDTLTNTRDAPQVMGVFTDALALLGFEVSLEADDEEDEIPILTYSPQNRSLSGSPMDEMVNEANLLCSVVSGAQLCIHAGRADYSEGLLHLARSFYSSTSADAALSHSAFGKVVEAYLTILHQGSTCGRGSFSSNYTFHLQLCLSLLSHFSNSYAQFITKSYNCTNNEPAIYELENQLKACMDLLLQVKITDTKEGKSLSALMTELEAAQPILPTVLPLESCAKLSESISLGQHLASAVAKEALELNDPQLVLEKIMFRMCSFLKSSSYKCSKLLLDASQNAKSTMQLNIISIFGPAIFTGVSSAVDLVATERLRHNGSGSTMLPRHEGILVQFKQMLMESIQYLDFSGTISDNKEGQYLLCPLFSMLAKVLVACASYTKAHVLLVNALHSAHSERNWAVFSDLLWSSLIQLHMIFPLPESLEEKREELVQRPLNYGVNPSKVILAGDSALVNCLRLGVSKSSSKMKKKNRDKVRSDFERIKNCCERLSLSCDDNGLHMCKVDSCIINLTAIHEPSSSFRLCDFPSSLYLLGAQMRSLVFTSCGLESLPIRFGAYFPQLKVRKCIVYRIIYVTFYSYNEFQDLDLAENRLSDLPDSCFIGLVALETLTLDVNHLKLVPAAIGSLSSLKHFSADHNSITDISSLLKCISLETIHVRNNCIAQMPIDLPLRLLKLRSYKWGKQKCGEEAGVSI